MKFKKKKKKRRRKEQIIMVTVNGAFLLVPFVFLIFCGQLAGQIHRAASSANYHAKYDAAKAANNFDSKSSIEISNMTKSSLIITDIFSSVILLASENNRFDYSSEVAVWLASITSALLVGLSGVVPVLILPRLAINEKNHRQLVDSPTFKCLISFAAGTLLADVFLHLLPETFTASVLSKKIIIITIIIIIIIIIIYIFFN